MRAPSRESTSRIAFDPALGARTTGWHRMQVALELPPWYRMASPPVGRAVAPAPSPGIGTESESIEVESQARNYGQQVSSDARLRLQVVLPLGYRILHAQAQVGFLTDPEPGRRARTASHGVPR